jgi:hypothetical protein
MDKQCTTQINQNSPIDRAKYIKKFTKDRTLKSGSIILRRILRTKDDFQCRVHNVRVHK